MSNKLDCGYIDVQVGLLAIMQSYKSWHHQVQMVTLAILIVGLI